MGLFFTSAQFLVDLRSRDVENRVRLHCTEVAEMQLAATRISCHPDAVGCGLLPMPDAACNDGVDRRTSIRVHEGTRPPLGCGLFDRDRGRVDRQRRAPITVTAMMGDLVRNDGGVVRGE